jgi:hypothetical protein
MQSDRPRPPDDGKRDLPQLRALDPMPVLGDAGVVSSILNFVLKLASVTSTTDIFSHSVLRAARTCISLTRGACIAFSTCLPQTANAADEVG